MQSTIRVLTVLSSEMDPPTPLSLASVSPPLGTKVGLGQHSLAEEGTEGANSDDWRESLALCIILCGLY